MCCVKSANCVSCLYRVRSEVLIAALLSYHSGVGQGGLGFGFWKTRQEVRGVNCKSDHHCLYSVVYSMAIAILYTVMYNLKYGHRHIVQCSVQYGPHHIVQCNVQSTVWSSPYCTV